MEYTDNNKTNNPKNTTNIVQQIFHPSMFERARSNSLGALPKEIQKPIEKPKQPMERHPQKPLKPQQSVENETALSNPDDTQKEVWKNDRIPNRSNKRKQTSPILNDTQKKLKNTTNFAIPTSNTFEILNEDTTKEAERMEKEYIPKPEPIFATGVLNVGSLKEALSKVTTSEMYLITALRSGHVVKIMPKDIQTYKMIRENFISNNISHYTYQLKSERAYRVVLRGLHASEQTAQIAQELKEIGYEVRQVVNVRHRATKEPLPIFFVDLEPNPNNKNIFNVKYINNMKITFEAPHKKQEILQCKRCQRFGHSKNQCNRPYRCVKCGSDHPTNTCTKQPHTDATCANCNEKHPASYKGCQTYKQYRERITKSKPKASQLAIKTTAKGSNREDRTEPNQTNMPKTYAQITATKTLEQNHNIQHDRKTELNNTAELMHLMLDKLQKNMMTMVEKMMDKMMERMIQLVNSLLVK